MESPFFVVKPNIGDSIDASKIEDTLNLHLGCSCTVYAADSEQGVEDLMHILASEIEEPVPASLNEPCNEPPPWEDRLDDQLGVDKNGFDR